MNIQTKYNINDEVYVIDKGHLIQTATMEHWTWYPRCHRPETIDGFCVEGWSASLNDSSFDQHVKYQLFDPDCIRYVREEDCFLTLEEAQAECDRRNSEGASDPEVVARLEVGQ